MSLVLKSNTRYTGNQSLKSITDVSQTAQQFYDAYAAWVIADGGEIINPTQCLAAITWAKNWGVMGKSFAVSASWGIKRAGSNITKLYGIDRSTFSWAGTGVGTYTTINGFPEILFPATSARMVQDVPKRNITSKNIGVLMTAKKISSQYMSFSVNRGTNALNADIRVEKQLPPAFSYVSAKTTDATVTWNVGNVAGFNHGSFGSLININKVSQTLILNGAVNTLVYPAGGAGYADFASAETSEIWLGQFMLNNVPTGSPQNSFITEVWLINDATVEMLVDRSSIMTALYPATT